MMMGGVKRFATWLAVQLRVMTSPQPSDKRRDTTAIVGGREGRAVVFGEYKELCITSNVAMTLAYVGPSSCKLCWHCSPLCMENCLKI